MHVLVVEDDHSMAGLLEPGLDEQNHHVTVAGDGASGLEIAYSYISDVIVLDVVRPCVDGFEVARRLRGHFRFPATWFG